MQKDVANTLSMLRQAHALLERENPAGAYGPVAPFITQLGEHVERLQAFAIDGDNAHVAALGGTAELKRAARTLKLEFLRPLALQARIHFGKHSAEATALRYPSATRNPIELAVAARAIGSFVAAHRSTFAAPHFADDLAERLAAQADAVLEIMDTRAAALGRRAAAVAGMHDEAWEGRSVLGVIDTMVRPRFACDAARIAEWSSVVGERMYPGRKSPGERGVEGEQEGGEEVVSHEVAAMTHTVSVGDTASIDEVDMDVAGDAATVATGESANMSGAGEETGGGDRRRQRAYPTSLRSWRDLRDTVSTTRGEAIDVEGRAASTPSRSPLEWVRRRLRLVA